MPSTQATLSAASDDRKARLAKLKNLKRKQPADEVASPEAEGRNEPNTPRTGGDDGEHDTAMTEAPARTTTSSTAADEEQEAQAGQSEEKHPHLSGRNYDAAARGPRLGFETAPSAAVVASGATLEQKAAALEAQALADEKRGGGGGTAAGADDGGEAAAGADSATAAAAGIDLFNLQPKKPNWDLRRDLDRKLEALAVHTDNAIARLVRERVAAAQLKQRGGVEGGGSGGQQPNSGGADGDGEAVGMDGVALVEGLRVREREEEEDERREREDEDLA